MTVKKVSKSTKQIQDKARTMLKDFIKEQGVNASYIANKLKEVDKYNSDSRTNFLNKLARSSFKFTEVMQIVDMFGYELKIVPKTLIEQLSTTESEHE